MTAFITDQHRVKLQIRAVHVACNQDGDESYQVGRGGVTSIEWGNTDGHMAHLLTIAVYRNDELHSEHIFSNVLSVIYAAVEA
jgi:hypothetical protein